MNPNKNPNESKGKQCTPNIPLTKNPNNPPSPPPYFRWKPKQMEVMLYLSEGMNITTIAKKMSVSKPTILERLESLRKKGVVEHTFYSWSLTDYGRKCLEKQPAESKGDSKGKSIHANEFSIRIKNFPNGWENNSFIQCLKPFDYFFNKATGQWMLYFQDCTIRISPTTKSMTFWVKKQHGTSFDDIENDVFDKFVEYYSLMESNGFILEHVITSRSPEFANKDGFFARLAQHTTQQGFRIDTYSKSFWVDFSDGLQQPEEETNDYNLSRRMEKLAESAIKSDADFQDIDKLKEIVKDMVRHDILTLSSPPKHTNGIDRGTAPTYIG